MSLTTNEIFPVLYILMRNDLDSMNSGKAMAQASHASNAFVHYFQDEHANIKPAIAMLYADWKNSTEQGFGTVLVLAVNEHEMRFAVDAAKRYNLVAGVVFDPTYPLRDGDTTHFIPLDTCAYIFTDKNDPITDMLLGGYKLHP